MAVNRRRTLSVREYCKGVQVNDPLELVTIQIENNVGDTKWV